MLRERDDVHVAFDDDDAARIANRIACEVQAVELATLGEDRRLGRVQVLGLAAVENAAAEADHVPAAVVDREHDPVAEAVVALAVVAGDHESRRVERRIVVGRKRLRQVLPAGRRVADAEMRGDDAGQATPLQVRDRSRRFLQLRAIELRRDEQRFVQVLRNLALLALARPLDARHFEPGIARERLDGLGKRLAGVLH